MFKTKTKHCNLLDLNNSNKLKGVFFLDAFAVWQGLVPCLELFRLGHLIMDLVWTLALNFDLAGARRSTQTWRPGAEFPCSWERIKRPPPNIAFTWIPLLHLKDQCCVLVDSINICRESGWFYKYWDGSAVYVLVATVWERRLSGGGICCCVPDQVI